MERSIFTESRGVRGCAAESTEKFGPKRSLRISLVPTAGEVLADATDFRRPRPTLPGPGTNLSEISLAFELLLAHDSADVPYVDPDDAHSGRIYPQCAYPIDKLLPGL